MVLPGSTVLPEAGSLDLSRVQRGVTWVVEQSSAGSCKASCKPADDGRGEPRWRSARFAALAGDDVGEPHAVGAVVDAHLVADRLLVAQHGDGPGQPVACDVRRSGGRRDAARHEGGVVEHAGQVVHDDHAGVDATGLGRRHGVGDHVAGLDGGAGCRVAALGDGEGPDLVVVGDRAGTVSAVDDRHTGAGERAAGAGPVAGGVADRAAGLAEVVAPGVDDDVGDLGGPGWALYPGVGPSAARVQSVGTAVPPLSLVTVLTSVSVAAWSLLLMVQVADTPSGSTRLAPVRVPAVHDHAPAAYPARAGLGQRVRARAHLRVGHRCRRRWSR